MKKAILGIGLVGMILATGGWRVFAGEAMEEPELKQGRQAFVTKHYPDAFKWFRQAAEKGNLTAASFLGYIYAVGLGVEKDPKEAFKWLKKAAEAGNADAQYNLGCMYKLDLGIGKNDGEAFKWYLRAAKQGHVEAEVAVGFMYKKGLGVEQSLENARDWLQKAAEAGNEIAMTQMGYMEGYSNSDPSRPGYPGSDPQKDEDRLKQDSGYKAPGYSGGPVPHSPAHPSAPSHR